VGERILEKVLDLRFLQLFQLLGAYPLQGLRDRLPLIMLSALAFAGECLFLPCFL
jgi:hypothetical protein